MKDSIRIIFLRSIPAITIFAAAIFNSPIFAQEDKLEKAQMFYQHENFEEALALFKELKKQDPSSAEVAYYLGLTCKRLQDYTAAKPEFLAAVSSADMREKAMPELIDVLYQCNQLEEAKKWVAVSEKEFIAPAETAFFKGLVLFQEGKELRQALKSFDDAEKLDPALAQAVKYQKGIIYAQLNDIKQAKKLFAEVVIKDPAADLAAFANEYIVELSRREDLLKPFHGGIGYAVQYDDNVVFRPNEKAIAADIFDKDDLAHVATTQGEYNLKANDKFGVKFGYFLYKSKHNSIGYYDTGSYDFPVQPVIYLEKASIAFPVHYNYVRVNDKRYLDTIGLGNLNNIMLSNNKMVQFQLQYNSKEYHWAATSYAEKKDGCEYLASAGWFNFFAKNQEGLVNIRYAANYEDTKGRNWTYVGNRLTLTVVSPLSKRLKWNFVSDYFRQDFSKINTTYNKKRRDNVFTVSDLLAWELYKNTELHLQHTFVYDSASIGVYKYTKNLYSMGMKYRF